MKANHPWLGDYNWSNVVRPPPSGHWEEFDLYKSKPREIITNVFVHSSLNTGSFIWLTITIVEYGTILFNRCGCVCICVSAWCVRASLHVCGVSVHVCVCAISVAQFN